MTKTKTTRAKRYDPKQMAKKIVQVDAKSKGGFTAKDAEIPVSQVPTLIKANLIKPRVSKGQVVTRRVATKGRPAYLFTPTIKARSLAKAA